MTVAEPLQDYLLEIVEATRTASGVRLGASTRAALALYRAAQAKAVLENRTYVIPDDIKTLARPVLAHRLILKSMTGATPADAGENVIAEIVGRIAVPR